MNNKYRIAVLGIGGVGGYIGGRLAAYYAEHGDAEIIFIARGDNKQAIKENGLKVISAAGEQIVHPHLVSDDPNEIGPIDLLLCCTKAYSIEDSMRLLAACISKDTVILPLLNGVDNTERIKSIFPDAQVLYGCIYIVSKLIGPGIVKQSGNVYSLHFGSNEVPGEQLSSIEKIFKDAGINAIKEEDMIQTLWQKFSFLSPLATYTSATNMSVGKILAEEEHRNVLIGLMQELLRVALVLGIKLPDDTIERNLERMSKFPYEATSSMQTDFVSGKNTELETLTGFVVRNAGKHKLQVNNYEALYETLKAK